MRGRAGDGPHSGEEGEADAEGDGDVEGDLAALVGGGLGAGAVGAKGDPVCWRRRRNVSLELC